MPKPEPIDQLLSEPQRAYLRGIADDPTWRSILDTLAKVPVMPEYSPDKESHQQFYRWVYESAGTRRWAQMLHLLSNGRVQLNLKPLTLEE